MRVTNGNLSLHVAEDGDPSAPPIVLLHGIIGSGATWQWFVPELAERFRVLRLDFRGHGQSDRAPGTYVADNYVADAVAALEQAAGQPCVAIGHSLGGATAAAVAQRRPDLLTGAVLEDPPLDSPAAGEGALPEDHALVERFTMLRETIPKFQESGITLDAATELISAVPDSSGATFGEILVPDGVESMALSMLNVDASVLDPVLDGSAGVFLDPATPLGVPTLVLAADPKQPDAVATAEAGRHFASISPDVEVVVIDGAGHLIHNERASRDRFRATVSNFLARLDST